MFYPRCIRFFRPKNLIIFVPSPATTRGQNLPVGQAASQGGTGQANPYLPGGARNRGARGGVTGGEGDLVEPTPAAPVPTTRRFTEDELRAGDERLQDLTSADRKLIDIFGDTIHQNDGSHLRGGVSVACGNGY